MNTNDTNVESGAAQLLIQGLTPLSVKQTKPDELVFDFGEYRYVLYHEQDCCESVIIDDISGDLSDLEGQPLVLAEETWQRGSDEWGSDTWTFYRFMSPKGAVQVKWHGSSNGYYSESVHEKVVRVSDGHLVGDWWGANPLDDAKFMEWAEANRMGL